MTLLTACTKPPSYPDEPVIAYESISQSAIFQGTSNNPEDELLITFSFTDGDGNISSEDSIDVFLTDSRNPALVTLRKIPDIPSEGTGNGISGDVIVRINNRTDGICCIDNNVICVNDPDVPIDTFSYTIQIRDRANNYSNKIQTETITIVCRQ